MGCLALVAVGKHRPVDLKVDNRPLPIILTDDETITDPVLKKTGVAVTVSGVNSGVEIREVEVLGTQSELVWVGTASTPPIAHAIPTCPLELGMSPFERSALAVLASMLNLVPLPLTLWNLVQLYQLDTLRTITRR